MCRPLPGPNLIVQALTAITGIQYQTMDLLTFGERFLNLKRAINNKLGVTRQDDKLPKIVRRALKEGATSGIEPGMDLMLKDFYDVSKWDWETGKPTREKLMELEFNQTVKDLWG